MGKESNESDKLKKKTSEVGGYTMGKESNESDKIKKKTSEVGGYTMGKEYTSASDLELGGMEDVVKASGSEIWGL